MQIKVRRTSARLKVHSPSPPSTPSNARTPITSRLAGVGEELHCRKIIITTSIINTITTITTITTKILLLCRRVVVKIRLYNLNKKLLVSSSRRCSNTRQCIIKELVARWVIKRVSLERKLCTRLSSCETLSKFENKNKKSQNYYLLILSIAALKIAKHS